MFAVHVEQQVQHLCHKPYILLKVACLVSKCICSSSNSRHASTSAPAPPLRIGLQRSTEGCRPEAVLGIHAPGQDLQMESAIEFLLICVMCHADWQILWQGKEEAGT